MKMFRFGTDEDGDTVFCIAGLVSFTEYKGAVLVSWGDATRYARETPHSWGDILIPLPPAGLDEDTEGSTEDTECLEELIGLDSAVAFSKYRSITEKFPDSNPYVFHPREK